MTNPWCEIRVRAWRHSWQAPKHINVKAPFVLFSLIWSHHRHRCIQSLLCLSCTLLSSSLRPLHIIYTPSNMPTAVRPERESVPAVPMGSTSPRSISVEDLPTLVVDSSALEIASRVLAVINRYRLQGSRNDSAEADGGASKFLAVIHSHVRAGNAVPMCLPAFPFKSPNNSAKVLGRLPDRAEELALAHLNGLCQAIQDIYPPGAKLTIISDGLVYNGTSSMRSKLCHCLSKKKTVRPRSFF